MASAPDSAQPINKRARRDAGPACVLGAENFKERRRRREAPPGALADEAPPAPANPSRPTEDQLDLLWGELQKQMLELLSHGVAAPFQRRAFDKLDYSMKQYAKARRERADNMLSAQTAEPDAEELAAILNKIDRRIDELAEDRFKKLGGGEFHAPAMDESGAGMDV